MYIITAVSSGTGGAETILDLQISGVYTGICSGGGANLFRYRSDRGKNGFTNIRGVYTIQGYVQGGGGC